MPLGYMELTLSFAISGAHRVSLAWPSDLAPDLRDHSVPSSAGTLDVIAHQGGVAQLAT
jgi:hypothetical protein